MRLLGSLLLLPALCLGLLGVHASRSELLRQRSEYPAQRSDTPLYLPEAKSVQLVTFGFRRFVADMIWFNTVNYFGKHYRLDKDYRWLKDRCNVVTELNPTADHVYEFCSTLLAWEAKQPDASSEILTKAIAARPAAWRYRYLRGFNAWYFHEDKKAATEDLRIAAELPNAPPFVASQAAQLLSDTDSPETAVDYLRSLLANTKEPEARKALGEKLQLAQLTLDLYMLRQALAEFERRTGQRSQAIDDLVTSGLITGNPIDPFGGQYLYNPVTDELSTTSGRKGLKFHGRTFEESDFGKEPANER